MVTVRKSVCIQSTQSSPRSLPCMGTSLMGLCLKKTAGLSPSPHRDVPNPKGGSQTAQRQGPEQGTAQSLSAEEGTPPTHGGEDTLSSWNGNKEETMDKDNRAQELFKHPLSLCCSPLSPQTCRRSPTPHTVCNSLSQPVGSQSQLLIQIYRPTSPSTE